jgi:hypothetical protein
LAVATLIGFLRYLNGLFPRHGDTHHASTGKTHTATRLRHRTDIENPAANGLISASLSTILEGAI